MITIRDGKISADGTAVSFQSSVNRGGKLTKPTAIILHDTASSLSPAGDIAWLKGGPGQSKNASAPVVIDRFGKITQLINLDTVAWHAGASKWNGRSGCNAFTLGFEIDNPGGPLKKIGIDKYAGIATFDVSKPAAYGPKDLSIAYAETPQHGKGYWLAYTDEQLETVVALCRAAVDAYPSIKEIITHWMVSPGRKIDTNPLFPLQAVRDRVFGGVTPRKQTPAQEKSQASAAVAFVADATINTNDLNMRRTPEMGDNIVGKLPIGTRVDVREASGDWLLIRTPMGYQGYVFAKMVTQDK